MLEYMGQIVLVPPPDRVFAFLTTAANYPRWDARVVELRSLNGESWRLGTRLRERRWLGPQLQTLDADVVAYDPPRQLVIASVTAPHFRGGWELRPRDGATEATYVAELAFTGFSRVLEPLIAPSFAAQLDTNLARLRDLLASGA